MSAWSTLPVSLSAASQPSSRSSSGQLPVVLEAPDPTDGADAELNDRTFGGAADGLTAGREMGSFAHGTFVAHRSQAELGVGRMPTPPLQAVGAERTSVAVGEPSRQREAREVSCAAVFDRAPSPERPSPRPEPSERASDMTAADSVLRQSAFLQDLLDRLIRIELAQKSTLADVHSLRTDVDFLLRQHRQAGASSTESPSVATGYLGPATPHQQPIVLTQEQLRQLVAGQEDAPRSYMGSDEVRQLSAAREELQQLRAQVAELTVAAPVRSAPPSPFRAPDPARRSSLAVVQTQPPLSTPPFLGPGSRRQSLDVRLPALGDLTAQTLPSTGTSASALWDTTNASGTPMSRWQALGVAPEVAQAAIGYGVGPPTKIHSKAFPVILGDQDVVAQASSVQERVAAYMLPAINMLRLTPTSSGVQCIVVTATVDQASYAQRLGQAVGAPFGLRIGTLASSGPSGSSSPDAGAELRSLQHRPPNVLVGTPQRLLDVFAMRSLPLDHLRLVVLDEVDDMVARNLSELVLSLVRLLPTARPIFDPFGTGRSGSHERQTILMASTVPQEVLNFASTLQLRPPVRVLVRRESVMPSGSTTPGAADALQGVRGARHHYLFVAIASGHSPPGHGAVSRQAQAWKLEALTDLVEDADVRQMVVFCSSVQTVEAVSYKLASRGIDALALHGDMGSSARSAVMSRFRSSQSTGGATKKALILVDSLAHLLVDIHQIPLVVVFDVPKPEAYATLAASAASASFQRPGIVVTVAASDEDIDKCDLRG